MDDELAIEVADLCKAFSITRRRSGGPLASLRRETKQVMAVAGVSFHVRRGEMVGYIGPNGAGKSTTIKMLTGILMPSSGSVRVAGLEPQRSRAALARRIGIVFGQRTQLWWDLPLRDSFELLRLVYRVPAVRFHENMAAFSALLELQPLLDVPVRQLSLGQRMRGDLAAALLHDPEILYLDEPTIGLDVVIKERMRAFLKAINQQRGVTVLLTTHDMDDIEQLCPRTVVIDHGRVIYDGALESLKERFGAERRVVVDLEQAAPPLSVPGARVERLEGARQWLAFRRDATTAAAVIAAVVAQVRVRDLTVEEPAIDDVVRRIYAGAAA